MDVVFVNTLSFLVSFKKRLKSTTIEYILNRLEKYLDRSVNKILDVYKTRLLNPHYVYGP